MRWSTNFIGPKIVGEHEFYRSENREKFYLPTIQKSWKILFTDNSENRGRARISGGGKSWKSTNFRGPKIVEEHEFQRYENRGRARIL